MKKFVSIVLSLLLVVNISSIAFSSDSLTVSFDIYEKSTEKKAIITSSMNTSDLDLYVAAFSDDKMTAVEKIDLHLEKGINVVETGINFDDVEKNKIKLFVWNYSLCPFAKYEFPVTRPPSSKLSIFIITGNTEINYNGNKAYRLSGIHNGKESRIIVYNPNGYGEENPENLLYDDVILISPPDGEGVVNYIEKVDAEKIEGVVSQTPLTLVAGGIYTPSSTGYVKIGKNTVSIGNIDINPHLGKYVTAYIGNNTLYTVLLTEGTNNSFTINANQINNIYEDMIIYRDFESSSKNRVSLASDLKLFINYQEASSIEELADTYKKGGGTIDFVSNDADDEIEYIIATSYNDEAVIKSIIEHEDGSYSFECYTGQINTINPADKTKKAIIYRNGNPVPASKLTEEDTISHIEIAENLDIYYVSSISEEGYINGWYYNSGLYELYITISDATFTISPLCNLDKDSLLSLNGIFYINSAGEISHFEPDDTAMQSYALVTSVYKGEITDSYYLQSILENNDIVEYEISEKVSILDENGNMVLPESSDSQAKSYFNTLLTEVGDTGSLDATYSLKTKDLFSDSTPENLIVSLRVRSGKISKIILPNGPNLSCNQNSKYDADNVTIMGQRIDKESKIFIIKSPANSSDFVDVNSIEIGTVLEYFTDGESYNNINLYAKGDKTDVYKFLVCLDLEKPTIDLNSVFVIGSKRVVSYNNSIAYSVTGFLNGRETALIIYNEDGYGEEDPSKLKEGDILIIKELSENNLITQYQQLVSFNFSNAESSTIYATRNITNDNNIYSGYGMLKTSNQSGFSINKSIKNDFSSSIAVSSGSTINYEKEANYTLVSYYQDDEFVEELTIESASETLFDTDYSTYVYVRYVEGKISDVVIYRMLE